MKVEAIVLNRSLRVTVNELCEMCRISREEVIGMVEEGIIDPLGNSRQEWRFQGYDIKKYRLSCDCNGIWGAICPVQQLFSIYLMK